MSEDSEENALVEQAEVRTDVGPAAQLEGVAVMELNATTLVKLEVVMKTDDGSTSLKNGGDNSPMNTSREGSMDKLDAGG
jgi:hypothetical protein